MKSLKEFWWNNFGWRIRNIYRSVKKLIYWLPVVWNDRDWDHSFIYKILDHKLSGMAKYFRERDFFVGEIREAERMELCSRLIKRVNEDFYAYQYQDIIEEKYGKEKMYVDPVTHHLEFKFVDKEYTKEELESINKEKAELMQVCAKKQIKAKRLLFALIERNIDKWWD